MSTRFKGFALLAILAAAVGAVPVFAQESPLEPITVTTDKVEYSDGETVTISGVARDYISGIQVSVIVLNPIGNIVTVQQVDVETDKTYSTTLTAGGGLWKASGTYTIKVQYGSENRANETTFEFGGSTGGPSGKKIHVDIDGNEFDLRYSITGGKIVDIVPDIESKSLIISIETTSDGELTITLPRAMIESQIENVDTPFFVLVDGAESESSEESDSTDRTLTIPFYDGAEEIEIIGTWIIPEFGPIAALVLAVAIISIIAVSAKTRLRLVPKF